MLYRLNECCSHATPPPAPRSGRRHDRLALAGLDHYEARAVEGQLEGLARAGPNEGAHLEGALDLRLQVRRLTGRRLRGSEARPLVAVQTHPRAVRGRGCCLARWWRLAVECCGRGEDPATEFRIRYCHG